jgi:uncharacterized protein YcfJ
MEKVMKFKGHSALVFRHLTLGIVVSCLSLTVSSPSYSQSSSSKPAVYPSKDPTAVPQVVSPSKGQMAAGQLVYPSKGQTAAVQEEDTAACNSWAQVQTGFDPITALKAQQDNAADSQNRAKAFQDKRAAVGGEAIGGAARGAVTGVAIGAILGDAGKGAAVGATAGAANGRARNRAKRRDLFLEEARARELEAKQQTLNNQKLADYQKAIGVCMEGRGYVVR